MLIFGLDSTLVLPGVLDPGVLAPLLIELANAPNANAFTPPTANLENLLAAKSAYKSIDEPKVKILELVDNFIAQKVKEERETTASASRLIIHLSMLR